MRLIAGIAAALFGVGIGLLVYAALGTVVEAAGYLMMGRMRRALRAVMDRPEESRGRGTGISLVGWMAICAVGGLLASIALIPEGPARVMGALAGIAPLVWQRQRAKMLRQEIQKGVANLLEDIRLQMAFGGSLAYALATLAETGSGPVYGRLRGYRETLFLQGPEETLKRLGDDLESPELQIFLARLETARHGRSSYEQVLEEAVSDAVREGRRAAEAEIEGAPLRLLLPMLFLLFPPVLVLVLYPPAYALIAQLAGAGSGVIP